MADTILQLYANFIEEKYVDLSFFLSVIEAAFEKVKRLYNYTVITCFMSWYYADKAKWLCNLSVNHLQPGIQEAPEDIISEAPALLLASLLLVSAKLETLPRLSCLFIRGYSAILAIFLLFMYDSFYFWNYISCSLLTIFSIHSSHKAYHSQLVITSFWQREVSEREY